MLNYQVKNKKIDLGTLYRYKSFKLFSEEETTAENTILLIDEYANKINKSQKDLSNWLTLSEDHTAFFITDIMKKIYKGGVNKKAILKERKKLLLKTEKIFVENLGLKYFLPIRKSRII